MTKCIWRGKKGKNEKPAAQNTWSSSSRKFLCSSEKYLLVAKSKKSSMMPIRSRARRTYTSVKLNARISWDLHSVNIGIRLFILQACAYWLNLNRNEYAVISMIWCMIHIKFLIRNNNDLVLVRMNHLHMKFFFVIHAAFIYTFN